jgi:GR25 family glycosyltransferase involved in LPS biosynthesis
MYYQLFLIFFLFFILNFIVFCYKKTYQKINHFEKINHIDHIVWINLDRSEFRRGEMLKKLHPISIPKTRIQAVDGKNKDLMIKMKENLKLTITDYEFACLLSHIKAISFCESLEGQNFLILEDDVSFKNLEFFKISLKDIISNSPTFDILMIYKNLLVPLPYLYTDWNEEFAKGWHISGAVGYIINRQGIKKIKQQIAYHKKENKFTYYNRNITLADIFLFQNCKTMIYKYNFFSVEIKDSTIHTHHLPIQNQCVNFQQNEIMKNLMNNKI